MPPLLRILTAFLVVVLLVPAAWAQNDRDDEDDEAIVIRRDGHVIFRDHDGHTHRFEFDGDRPFMSDTTIDGRRVIRFRTPDGDEQTFDFRMPDPEHLLRFKLDHDDVEADMERFRHDMEELDGGRHLFRLREGVPFGAAWADEMEGLAGHFGTFRGASEETRREMRELELRTRELAARYRRAEGAERAERAERELDDVLGRLFELRGQAREEAAAHLDEQAERLREQARALREALHERDQQRRALIEERKRELTGERGSDW